MLLLFPRVVETVAHMERIIATGERMEVVALLAAVASLRVLLIERAHALRSQSAVTLRRSDTASMTESQESRLLTADEAAVLFGPSCTAKRLYRLRGSMPEQAWIRKGGRLYFREGPFRRWLATR